MAKDESDVCRTDVCRGEKVQFCLFWRQNLRGCGNMAGRDALLEIIELIEPLCRQHAPARPAQPESPGIRAEVQQTQTQGLCERGLGL